MAHGRLGRRVGRTGWAVACGGFLVVGLCDLREQFNDAERVRSEPWVMAGIYLGIALLIVWLFGGFAALTGVFLDEVAGAVRY